MNEPEKKPRRRVKKVKGHGGHHGGAWKVAYADFVTAMMALFLVLWLVSQADVKLKESIANYFRSPGVFSSTEGGVLGGPKKVSKAPEAMTSKDEEQALFSAAEQLRKKFTTNPQFLAYKDRIKIELTEQGLRIQIVDKAERVTFSSSSARLTPDARAVLAEVARGICELPNPISIGGHTDRHLFAPGSPYTNWELSADRANAARRELESNCVAPAQIRRVVGHADTELLLPDEPFSPANRRISITVMRIHQPPSSDAEKDDETGKSRAKETNGDGRAADDESRAADDESEAARNGSDGAKPLEGAKTGDGRALRNRLASEGSVAVGEPDAIPSNVKRSREKAKPAASRE